jgi:hypothetical protein
MAAFGEWNFWAQPEQFRPAAESDSATSGWSAQDCGCDPAKS